MCLSGRLLALAGLVMVSVFPIAGTTINITPGAGLVGNTAALAAFNRAANTWAAMFSDPVTINIDANLGFLAPNVIGQASSVQLVADYDAFRDALAFDASDEADDAIVGFLPTRAQLSASLPAGVTLSNNMQSTKANLKALGVSGLDELFGSSDASITFNSNFGFDYDRLDGTVGVDFESVALHEIGHALGFVSAVDTIDNLTGPTIVNIFPLDLFRFNGLDLPTDPVTFANTVRELRPGQNAFTSDSATSWRMSTGRVGGDGYQASHWKDDSLNGGLIVGAMDPALATGVLFSLSMADIRALDLIGWEGQTTPEPGAAVLLSTGMAGIYWRRRRQQR